MSDEFDIPEVIIHVVQSFLTSEEAARTTLLSKSWRNAWLTRPNLDIDLPVVFLRRRLGYPELYPKFLDIAEKELERYENSNIKIDSFGLRFCISYDDGYPDSCPVTKLVLKALKLGPTRLTFKTRDESYPSEFRIPDEVYRYEKLLSLTVNGCNINPNREEVCCSKLQFLSLNHISIERTTHESTDMIFRIISSCPLIEKLTLCHINDDYGDSVDVDRLPTISLHRLTSLVLENVYFDSLFLADLSFKFPSLKDLTLHLNNNREKILISSPTLERLDFSTGKHYSTVQRVKLDVPSIRKLTFVCSHIPKLYVRSHSRGWESHVSVTRDKCLSVSWFYRLSKFLKKLRLSRIFLSLHVYSRTTFDYEPGNIKGLPKPEIENLNIYHLRLTSQSCCVFFDGLFRMCHPKVITQYMSNNSSYRVVRKTNNIHFLGKRLLEARDAKVSFSNYQYMYGLNDLKEARAQVLDGPLSTWRDVTLESLVDEDSTNSEQEHQSDDESWDELSKGSTTTYETDDDSTILGGSDYDWIPSEKSDCAVDNFPVIRFQLNWKQLETVAV